MRKRPNFTLYMVTKSTNLITIFYCHTQFLWLHIHLIFIHMYTRVCMSVCLRDAMNNHSSLIIQKTVLCMRRRKKILLCLCQQWMNSNEIIVAVCAFDICCGFPYNFFHHQNFSLSILWVRKFHFERNSRFFVR